MLLMSGEARYADLIDTTLFNAVLPGISLDGERYFYQNPLSADGAHRRQPWFYCACCPPNVARLLASLSGYFYSTSDEGVWVHLYAQGSADVALPAGPSVRIRQRAAYPWDGVVVLEVEGDAEFTLFLRIPAWCSSGAAIEINGVPHSEEPQPGSYAAIRRKWRSGDSVRLSLPMDVRLVEAHPYLSENAGRVAVFRGPLLYCAEQADNPDLDPRDALLPANPAFAVEHRSALLGGVNALRTAVRLAPPAAGWTGRLYRPAATAATISGAGATPLTLVPYYAWANRDPGRMEVWLRSAGR
jgi:hypothetical protein